MLTALLIALTPIAPKKPPVIYLKTNSILLTSEVNHAVKQYCLTHETKTLAAIEADITSNIDFLLKIPRMIQANKLDHNEITAQEYRDRQISDTNEVRDLIKNRVKKKCPAKD